MNNFFLVLIVILLVVSGSFTFFYTRDVLNTQDVKGESTVNSCVPLNLQIKEIQASSFVVEWETTVDCLSLVKYGDSIDRMNYISIDEDNDLAKSSHSIKVRDLNPASIYYIGVFSGGVGYGLEGAPIVVYTKPF